MIITADSGSTSIDWRIIRRGAPAIRLESPGVNPALQDADAVRRAFGMALGNVVEELGCGQSGTAAAAGVRVFFYGAGVVSEAAGEKVREALAAVLPCAAVTVGTDLEAAALALLGGEDGIAAILGTGSNSGLFLGGRIVRNIPAGGFILGDEGSGAWLGKMLLSDFIKGLLPEDLDAAFRKEYPGLDYPAVVEKVYRGEMPSRYLASFSVFLSGNMGSGYVRNLVAEGFRLFLRRNVLRYGRPDLPLAAVGSVACVYGDILRSVAAGCGVCRVVTARSAGDGLEAYFSKLIMSDNL